MESPPLSQIARSCQTAIADLLAAVGLEESSYVKDLLSEKDVEQIQERYDQWAGNIGAFQPSSSALSLDHRLQNSSQVRNVVLSTLKDLHISLQTATDIATGRRPNRVTSPLDIDPNINLSEYNISSSESDSSSVYSSGMKRNAIGPTSEIQELISAIKSGLDGLFRASVFIRKLTSNDRRQRASRAKPFDNRADAMYIKDRYPALVEKNEALAVRLGEANARRRQYFKYRRDHNDRLATVRESQDTPDLDRLLIRRAGDGNQKTGLAKSVATGQTIPSLFADTEATAFVTGEIPEAQLSGLLDASAAKSVVSFATSIAEASDNELPFPPLPSDADGRSSFICPYCLTVVQLKQGSPEHQWRKHVLQDLEPYICTFPTCGLETYQSQHAWFEHELLVHRNQFVCPQCSGVFPSSHGLERHIKRSHSETISNRQVPMIIAQSKQPIDSIPPTDCLFCDGSWATGDQSSMPTSEEVLVVDLDSFRRHMGHHLQQVALFSLPRLTQDQAGSRYAGGLPDRDETSTCYRWLREDCGRGWSIVSRRRTTFIALAYFLALYRDRSGASSMDSEKLPAASRELDDRPGNTLADWNPDDLSDSTKREGPDWYAVFNPEVPRVLDVVLVHDLVHDSIVCCVRFSPDGQYLATGSKNLARIFDVFTGQEIAVFQDETTDINSEEIYIRSICFSPGGRYLATGGEVEHIKIWDINARTMKYKLSGHEGTVFSIDWVNPQHIISGGEDKTVRLWDTVDGKLIFTLRVEDTVAAVAMSPDGSHMAAALISHNIKIWETTTGSLVEDLKGAGGHKDSVYSLAFTPNGKYLVSGSLDNTVKIWELDLQPGVSNSGKCTQTLNGHKDYVICVYVTLDIRWVISGSKDRGVQFWDPSTGIAHMRVQGHTNTDIPRVCGYAAVVGMVHKYLLAGFSVLAANIWSVQTVKM
ncbi:hypothetical protein BDW59DRAFT_156119 [Aspergillus cavernicola]|uniref:C2H2-type domain-containing protein n=1 Tax=Aspergillus cavernicola TaxID=176166 RepID=A0ABR4J2Q4_9EURO